MPPNMEQKCLIYNNNSLNFFRAVCGILALVAFLIQNQWLVLATSILVAFGAFSIKFNVLYQFHDLFLGKVLKEDQRLIQKESGELKFVYGLTGGLLLAGFLLLFFGKFASFAWILILIVALLMLLASFTGLCVASLMYAVFKKVSKR